MRTRVPSSTNVTARCSCESLVCPWSGCTPVLELADFDSNADIDDDAFRRARRGLLP